MRQKSCRLAAAGAQLGPPIHSSRSMDPCQPIRQPAILVAGGKGTCDLDEPQLRRASHHPQTTETQRPLSATLHSPPPKWSSPSLEYVEPACPRPTGSVPSAARPQLELTRNLQTDAPQRPRPRPLRRPRCVESLSRDLSSLCRAPLHSRMRPHVRIAIPQTELA